MSHKRRVIAQIDWPWASDKKKPEDKRKAKSRIADSMKMKRKHGGVQLKRLKPITKIIRKPNGEVNKTAVKNLIHSLEGLMKSK